MAPAAISSTPSPFPQVSFSPRNTAAERITKTTLSLSMKACDSRCLANLQGVKIAESRESGGDAG